MRACPQRNTINPDRFVETFQILLAKVFQFEWQAFRQRFAYGRCHAQAAGRGELLETLRQHNPGAGNRIVRDYDFAERNTDTQTGEDFIV